MGRPSPAKSFFLGLLALAAWVSVYRKLEPAAQALADALPLPAGPWKEAVAFFAFEVPKILLLLMLIASGVGILRSFFTPAKTRRWLAGKRQGSATILAALVGVVTPFCSCSAVPLFLGMLTAGVPLGVTLAYLVSAPMINEVALLLLFSLAGWKIALLYLLTGLSVAIVTGLSLANLNPQHWLEPWVLSAQTKDEEDWSPTWPERLAYAWENMVAVLKKVWVWIVAGVAVGTWVHGWVPQALLERLMGPGAWWSVPAVVVLGVPLYSNAAGIVPLVSALLHKGAAIGTVLAFMMSVTALSLPEALILRQAMRLRLLALFFGTVAVGILLVGWMFNGLL